MSILVEDLIISCSYLAFANFMYISLQPSFYDIYDKDFIHRLGEYRENIFSSYFEHVRCYVKNSFLLHYYFWYLQFFMSNFCNLYKLQTDIFFHRD